MRGRMRAHLTYANVMATIAVFIALGGVAYAANTIDSADVIDNSLRSVDLKDDQAVKSADVRDDTLAGGGLGGADIAPDALGGADINEADLGIVPNANQLDGIDSPGFMRAQTYRAESPLGLGTTLGDGTQTMSASCDTGDVMLSGGPANIGAATILLESFPSGVNSWTARVQKNGGGDNYSVVVLCASQ
jgi:hypothetical protein